MTQEGDYNDMFPICVLGVHLDPDFQHLDSIKCVMCVRSTVFDCQVVDCDEWREREMVCVMNE